MATFEVSAAGRAALRDHLILISEPHRRFAVIYEGLETQVAAKEKTGEADRPEQDAFVKALVSIFETSARRAAAELARPRLGNLTAAGRYAEARRKARLKRDRDARDLPYGPSLAEYEREALIDAIEKAYADGCAAAKETP